MSETPPFHDVQPRVEIQPLDRTAGVDFKAIFEASPSLLLVLTRDYFIAGANDAYCAATGTRREAILGRHLFEVFPDANPDNPAPTGVSNLKASLDTVVATRRPHEMALQRYDVANPDGVYEERYWRPLNTPVLGADGQVKYVVHRVEDATADVRLAASEASRRSTEEVLARAVAILPMGLSFVDADLVYRWTNPAMLHIFGLARDQVVGRRVPEVFPEGWSQIEPILTEVMTTGEPFLGRELPFTINHRKAYFDVTYQPVRSADGRLEGILSLAHEVTALVLERQQQRDQIASLREVDEAKDQFLGILSHELRTPINAILGFSSLLEDEVGGGLNPEQHRFTNHILTATDRLLALVNDLLDMSRIQAGKFTIAAVPMPVDGLVDEVLANLAPAAKVKQIALVPLPQPGLPWVRGDRMRLEQVVANLVGNAIKFTQPGGRVEVRTRRTDGHLRVEVADNGPGIPSWAHEKLFKTFSQVDMSATRASGGVGLGLAICKSLVEAHGGEIGVESGEGLGTTIWFTLPAVPQPPS